MNDTIVNTVRKHYPDVSAIYRFGSCDRGTEWPDSDVDVALLFPPEQARTDGNVSLDACHRDLEQALRREVDLVDIRRVSTVFQKEIIGGTRLYCGRRFGADEFEMLVISYYQKLNEERSEILAAFHRTGRAYSV